MKRIDLKSISSLEKVLPKPYLTAALQTNASCLKEEVFSYQLAFKGGNEIIAERLSVRVESDIGDRIELFDVTCVPVTLPRRIGQCDADYIATEDSVLPDLLQPSDGFVSVSPYHYKSLWVSVKTDAEVQSGSHPIRICLEKDGELYAETVFTLTVLDAVLPEQTLRYTQWFHADCIASYYGVDLLSEAHWSYIDKFIQMAAEHGINMLLTPLFTPPLDTEVGGERPTVQLVDVAYDGTEYSFRFDKLRRWLKLCRKHRIRYIELSHLFTQAGAAHTPKIEVEEHGSRVKKFGWHTDALSAEYTEFLAALLPELTAFLKEHWDADKVYYHISDEPQEKHLTHYGKVCAFVKPYLSEFHHIEALHAPLFYEQGYVKTPVVSTLTIDTFLERGIPGIWAYYCSCEGERHLSNRYIAMPSYRNRIMGLQLYKFGIEGFLHWGYNFYYSRRSHRLLNPFLENDGDGVWPAGDTFSVYPGAQGPLPSIRMKVFAEALQDLRALALLERKRGREAVISLIDSRGALTFEDYPNDAAFLLALRERVNRMIADA